MYFRILFIRAENKWGEITPKPCHIVIKQKKKGYYITPPVEPTDSGIVL